jgi:hypothetical protein
MSVTLVPNIWLGTRFDVVAHVAQYDGTAITTATQTVTATYGDGTSAVLTVVNDGAGDYHVSLKPPVSGETVVDWVVTAPVEVTTQDRFNILERVA